VVASALPECMAHPEVHIYHNADEFSAALDAVLAESRVAGLRERNRSVGQANSWATRVAVVARRWADLQRVRREQRSAA